MLDRWRKHLRLRNSIDRGKKGHGPGRSCTGLRHGMCISEGKKGVQKGKGRGQT